MSDKSQPVSRVFTQFSLFSALLCGRYSGVATVGEVKRYGNLAIATMERLDGEMLMVEGVVYQIRSDGSLRFPADSESIPFGTIADFHVDASHGLAELPSYEAFETEADSLYPDQNLPLAVHCKGVFSYMKCRSVRRQETDGIGLGDLAAEESIFEAPETEGELIGFRLPGYLKGVNAPGWHLHYIDPRRKFGGHVINFRLQSGILEVCAGTEYRLHLPAGALAGLDLTLDRSRDLERAEAER